MVEQDLDHLRKFVAPEFIFGIGARHLVGQYVTHLGARRVLVVTDPGLRAAGWVDELLNDLDQPEFSVIVYDSVTANPKDDEVTHGADRYRQAGCNLIVALGGGSVMDCAKGIAIVVSNGGHILDYEGVDQVPNPCPPLICIPTTAGTSADVSQFAIITDTDRKTKIAIISKAVVPDVALIDPQTTTTMDLSLTRYTGLDALTHGLEALVSNANSAMTDLHAVNACALIQQHLPAALAEPEEMSHRIGLMEASLHAGLAFSNASLGVVHAMAHSLGGAKDLPHGQCNAILLRHAVRFNAPVALDRYERVISRWGRRFDHMNRAGRIDAVSHAVAELVHQVGVNEGLNTLGVDRSEVPQLSHLAYRDPCIVTNPRRPALTDVEELYDQAL